MLLLLPACRRGRRTTLTAETLRRCSAAMVVAVKFVDAAIAVLFAAVVFVAAVFVFVDVAAVVGTVISASV